MEERNVIAGFLDLTADYLKDGHTRSFNIKSFDAKGPCNPKADSGQSLPLAYMVEEPADSVESADFEKSEDSLEAVALDITACRSCSLEVSRTRVVPGEGVNNPLVMVIGEGPGADEDATGRPFVGKAGQLLDKMLKAIGLYRDKNCFIANVVKCRPPGNRDPLPDEISACYPYLERQILLLRPRMILCVGRIAAQSLLKTSQGINALRGKITELNIGETLIPVLPTFHPSALLWNEALKAPAWEDLKLLRSELESLDRDYAAEN